jgi:threonine dehydratase
MKTKVIYRPTIEAIKKASLNLQEVALKTPLVKNDYYSKKYQSTILFKREDLQ